ncbi:Flagellin [Clostridium sp. N3C]|uniref:flagellin N-terminal helical domain-containing protein n=1 Tax=Clostridium sp. N3C TaxID=1776758 RepID=UPI00092E0614|nr:flagellin [Clostridium sp. N3C]SCN21291.1 Flagellin [Clostridium sp. N3C]
MIINHNLNALNAHRQMGINNTSAGKAMEKLSSGLRINRAGDDAAGLSISEKMRSQIRGLEQGSRNAQDGISLIQTAEGGLNETHAILQRMRELAVQAANDTNQDEDRAAIKKEIDELVSEIDHIAKSTNFNGKNLLNNTSSTEVNLQIGSGTVNDTLTLYLASFNANSTSLTVNNLKVDTNSNATNAIKSIDDAIKKVSTARSELGAKQNRLEHTITNLNTMAENLTASESRIRDVDMAKEMMNFSKNNILNQAAQAMLAQANQQPQGVLQLLR